MELVHLAATLDRLDDVVERAARSAVVFSCSTGDTVIAAAALEGRLRRPLGLWLEVSEDYPAQMAARDVATLSRLIEIDHVVIASRNLAVERAEVVRALLTEDEVNFSNAAATLVGAYNRPAPASPITVWSFDGHALRSPVNVLFRTATTSDAVGDSTTFA
ncbi:MAG TPA: hypothetical protein VMV96_00075 [Acidimicrobiales bacterium]|nr:hypothetical protein [Acidimicrobiales bacterium]